MEYWATQSPITKPGDDATAAIDALAPDLASLHNAASQLMLHYRGRSDDVAPDRRDEIHTRYADAMLTRILARGQPSLARERPPADRTVGCCRDATVLFLALARHKGIPARARVGFASYFMKNWMLDHVVAEVWDASQRRWRLVDAQMPKSVEWKKGNRVIDWLDLTPDDFQTGPQAWAAARRGDVDPSRYVVSPSLDLPELKGWPYLAHNVIHDLAALNKQEMLLWDEWGMLVRFTRDGLPEADALEIDGISSLLQSQDVGPDVLRKLMSKDDLAIPEVVTRFDPYGGPPVEVDIRRVVKGT